MTKLSSGWLSIYKPINITSSKVVLSIKKKFNLHKIGHAGTLDPLATGVLPIAFGEATKLLSFISNRQKKYRFIIQWGEQTDTDDSEGDIIFSSPNTPSIDEINKLLPKYIGLIDQVPPKYSAVKINGKRAYALSRKKIHFELVARKVHVESLKLIKNVSHNQTLFELVCGSGFYLRSFARDIAILLGTRGHIVSLNRLKVGFFNYDNTILLDDLLKISHLSTRIKGFYHSTVVLDDIPALTVSNEDALKIRVGKKLDVSFLSENTTQNFYSRGFVFAKNNSELIAIGCIKERFFKPKRVFNGSI